MAAVLRFPRTPALFVCHGWLPWEEAPPRHPRISRYLAVSEVTRERLVAEAGVPPERVAVVANFVDLSRFRLRGPLPHRPARALILNNAVGPGSRLAEAAGRACAEAGIALDIFGAAAGNATDRPEELLRDYDVVFAVGRTALEAMAVGCAVITARAGGLGALVGPAELDGMRVANFGLACTQRRIDAAAIAGELARYSPGDAAAVTARVRSECGVEAAVDMLVAHYRSVAAEPIPDARDADARAAARYVAWLGRRAKAADGAEAARRSAEQAASEWVERHSAAEARAAHAEARAANAEARAAHAEARAAHAADVRDAADRHRRDLPDRCARLEENIAGLEARLRRHPLRRLFDKARDWWRNRTGST